MSISDVESNVERIVRKAYSNIDFDVLIQKNILNLWSILKKLKRQQNTRKFKLHNFSMDLKLDFVVKFSLEMLKASFNTECLKGKCMNNSPLNEITTFKYRGPSEEEQATLLMVYWVHLDFKYCWKHIYRGHK